MLGDAGAEGLLLALAADGGQRVGSVLHRGQDPLDGFLGRGIGLQVLILGKEMVHQRRGAPPAHGVEHGQCTEEDGLGLNAVDPFVGSLGDLFQNQVAVVNNAVCKRDC